MTGQLVLRRQPLLAPQVSSLSSMSSSSSRRVGEIAGVTIVECAVVCCCPCAVFNLLVLTIYKLPAGLCRKAILRRRRRRQGTATGDLQMHNSVCPSLSEAKDAMVGSMVGIKVDDDVVKLEKEMWERFNGAGFWRSASQRMKLNNGSRRFRALFDLSPSHHDSHFSDRFEFDLTAQS